MSTISRRGRSRVAVFAVVAVLASLLALPLPAGAATAACPTTIPSAGFTDMGSYSAAAQAAADCIFDYGVTAGVGTGLYGPAANVPRWQMAIFLARVLESGGETLVTTDFGFTDIAAKSTAAQDAINAIANAGVTVGIGGGLYGPDIEVPRWQMAIFLAAVLEDLGVTLDTTAFGFTDIAAKSTVAQDSINAIANEAISVGVAAGLFGPDGHVTRVQMALFLAAELESAGVLPAGTGFIATAVPAGAVIKYADDIQGKEVTATTKSTEAYTVDGVTASQAVFLSKYTVGDLVVVQTGSWMLTNRLPSFYTSGTVDNVGAGATFDFVEPITGVTLNSFDPTAPAAGFTLFTIGGSPVSQLLFEADLQAGDTAVLTGTGADASHIRTAALTNVTVSGTVAAVGGASIDIGAFSDSFPVADGDTLSVDGTSVATAALFLADANVGDSATYGLAGGKVTATLTNKAATPVSGTALANYDIGADVTADTADDAFDFDDGTTVAVTLVHGGVDVLSVDGALVTIGEFNAALTPGDTIVYQASDTVVNLLSTLELKNVAGLTGVVVTAHGAPNVTVEFSVGGPAADLIDYTSNTPVGLSGTAVKYQVNGVSAVLGDFQTDLDAFIASSSITPKVTVSKVGNDIVWNLTSS